MRPYRSWSSLGIIGLDHIVRHTFAFNTPLQQKRHGSASEATSGNIGNNPIKNIDAQYPVIQLPARSLWCKQFPVVYGELVSGKNDQMIKKVIETRKYYQYPSMSAPQIGWNVQIFTLFDDKVYINPEVISESEEECWAWEPCASCAFLMHYIKRPKEVTLKYINKSGETITERFTKMRARLVLHEMDHMNGVLFTRRIPDTQHVVPLDGFNIMSDWPDDFPSLEARSTYMYTTFSPPYTFETDEVTDANMLDRKFEDGIYPGHEQDKLVCADRASFMEEQKNLWQHQKQSVMEDVQEETPASMKEVVPEEEE
eukprot:Tbor_TRINITY_DN4450_c0_g2::TRINITY_DN4450_c0_g2_i1::g.8068::m.8068/K01462/PDF, def; peptide deformylase